MGSHAHKHLTSEECMFYKSGISVGRSDEEIERTTEKCEECLIRLTLDSMEQAQIIMSEDETLEMLERRRKRCIARFDQDMIDH